MQSTVAIPAQSCLGSAPVYFFGRWYMFGVLFVFDIICFILGMKNNFQIRNCFSASYTKAFWGLGPARHGPEGHEGLARPSRARPGGPGQSIHIYDRTACITVQSRKEWCLQFEVAAKECQPCGRWARGFIFPELWDSTLFACSLQVAYTCFRIM